MGAASARSGAAAESRVDAKKEDAVAAAEGRDSLSNQRFARHWGRSHSRRAVRLRVRCERLRPPQARIGLERRNRQEEYCRVHRTAHEASHIESRAPHCDD